MDRRIKCIILLGGILGGIVSGVGIVRSEEAASRRLANASITSFDLRQHVDVLANDTLEGREAGSRGGHAAGAYLVDRLRKLGIAPAGLNGGYYQGFGQQYRNILATIEGSDPLLRHEVILIGAHYDHVGYGNRSNSFGPWGYIHNGADDNASGTSGLLELIEAWTLSGVAPRRTLLFCFWDGEEKGLLGSKHWLAQPTFPVARVKLAINMDMIGRLRGDRLEITGTRTSHGLRKHVADQNDETALTLDFSWKIEENSDHFSFFQRGIPFLMFHTGLHDDYHRPADDAEKLDFAGMERVVRLLDRVVEALANADEAPSFRAASRVEGVVQQKRIEEPYAPLPGRLGITWRPHDDPPGIRVASVQRNSAAAQAGLRVDDLLTQVQGREIDPAEFPERILSAHSSVTCTLLRAGEEPRSVEIALAGEPIRWGVTWREDECEPGSVIVLRVVPGSPAHKGGLQLLDRIMAVDGEPVSPRTLSDRLNGASQRVGLQVERRGRRQMLELRSLVVGGSL